MIRLPKSKKEETITMPASSGSSHLKKHEKKQLPKEC
jgi:hypothetical protein